MGRGNTNLDSSEYDGYLASKAKNNKFARRELEQRHVERRNAHDADGVGWHFGLGDQPVKAASREDLRRILGSRGLGLREEVEKELR
jgi:hypothetical protein